ncbi:MAG: DUF4159 domain-containing protein [Candidatus Latescibacteria bacterium]|nr:DUF4159 domain-containing protein [Candidatus Latescibacterota bacterium]
MALSEKQKISDLINIRKLEHETNRLFYSGLVFAVVFFAVLNNFIHWERKIVVKKEYRRIVTDLITRPPLKTKPLEIAKRDGGLKTLRRETREMSLPENEIALKPLPAPEKIRESPVIDADSIITIVRRELDRDLIKRIKSYDDLEHVVMERYYEDMSIRREPYDSKTKISFRDELLSVDDFDFGKYKALIFQDPKNIQDIEGFLYLPASIWGTMLTPVDSLKRAVTGLAEAFTKFTQITVHVEKEVFLDSPALLNYPFIYISADDNFDLSPEEMKNFGDYLKNGGFAFLEAYGTVLPNLPPKGAAPLKKMLKDTLGEHVKLQPIPNDHPFYHCFFNFEDGPPHRMHNYDELPYIQLPGILEGIFIDDRLVAIYSEKSYGDAWNKSKVTEAYQKIGVNAVVFALTQNGGNAYKLIDNVGIVQ